MLKFDLADVARFAARLQRLHLEKQDIKPLLEHWERRLEEGNRKGVLAGTDGKGQSIRESRKSRLTANGICGVTPGTERVRGTHPGAI